MWPGVSGEAAAAESRLFLPQHVHSSRQKSHWPLITVLMSVSVESVTDMNGIHTGEGQFFSNILFSLPPSFPLF